MNQDLPELINDDVEEEGDASADEAASDHNASGESGKRRHRDDSDIDEDLEDEDYDLIEENLGVRVDRVGVCVFLSLAICLSVCLPILCMFICLHLLSAVTTSLLPTPCITWVVWVGDAIV